MLAFTREMSYIFVFILGVVGRHVGIGWSGIWVYLAVCLHIMLASVHLSVCLYV